LSGQIYISEKMASRMVHKMVLGRAAEQKSPIERLTIANWSFPIDRRGHGTRALPLNCIWGSKRFESYRARIKKN